MRILIAGSHGLVGSAVTQHLIGYGHDVFRLVRQTPQRNEIWWSPDTAEIDKTSLDGFDGVVHLATAPWPMRWTNKAKQMMRANRLMTNRLLATSLAECRHKAKVLICASGMGYYPSSGNTVLTEDSPAGTSFLAKLQQDGEAVTVPASEAGIRVVHLRIPPVIGGSVLKRGSLQAGDGHQWVSWVGLDELASIIEFVLITEELYGPVNAVSPKPLCNAEFAVVSTQALGQKRARTLPVFMVRMIMGEMGEELLLASRRIQPAKLIAAGYQFRFPDLVDALRHEKENMNIEMATQPV